VKPVDPGFLPRPAEPPAETAGDGWTGAALIRPDGVIAWKPRVPAAEAAGQLTAVVASLLSRGGA
jgi:aromatic ring hydroxylase-like protein